MIHGPSFGFLGTLQIALFLAIQVAVLGWLYHHCRRPAVLAQLAWTIYTRTLGPSMTQAVFDNYGRQSPAAFRAALLTWNTVTDMIETVLFVWLIVSLVDWARPGLLRRTRRADSTLEELAARFGPPPPA